MYCGLKRLVSREPELGDRRAGPETRLTTYETRRLPERGRRGLVRRHRLGRQDDDRRLPPGQEGARQQSFYGGEDRHRRRHRGRRRPHRPLLNLRRQRALNRRTA